MIKQVLMLGAGAAAGWIGHMALGRGRDAAAVKAEETLRTTLHPSTLGRNAGAATATLLAEGARGFAAQLREEVPAWRTVSDRLGTQGRQTISGETVDAPSAAGTGAPGQGAAGSAAAQGAATGHETTTTPQTTSEEHTA
ncbi:hypothetical protein ACSBQY_04945 [Micrococcus lylae]|uniref:Uncharacterized protein n=1 Tax=Micrococcus lylae TaxID=1273 RepID=A0ABY2K4A9_9MICC|nr:MULTISPECIES: hypothetical protein [Micrococcus]PNL18094.1 hypothetical protein CEQ11_008405 [Micrococcus sp. FDAARGOS_333]TFH99772.1 hypothetical protein E4A49_04870 [Micrococcus lylae]